MNKNYKHIPRYIFTWMFGGRWKYGWNPNIISKIIKFYTEGWHKHVSLFNFINIDIKSWINIK